MARRNPWFSFESDNDDIDLDQNVTNSVTVLNETAADDAGDDSETTDVTPDTNETAHNEEASGGGVATGNNIDQLEVDCVAASERWIRKTFGLSREDMEEANDESVIVANNTPDADSVELTGDDDLDSTVPDAAETSGGLVSDADDTGIDNPALDADDGTVIETSEPVDGDTGDDEEAMENWYMSLEGGDGEGCKKEQGCDKKTASDEQPEEDDDESEEWFL